MPIKVNCSCGKTLNAPDSLAGKAARCPACQQVIKIPAASTAPTATPAPAANPAPKTAAAPSAPAASSESAPKSAGGSARLKKKVSVRKKVMGAKPMPKPAPAPVSEAPEPEDAADDYDDYDDFPEDKADAGENRNTADYDDAGADDDADSFDEQDDEHEGASDGITPAGLGKRIVALLIDGILINILCGALAVAIVGSAILGVAGGTTMVSDENAFVEGAEAGATAVVAGGDVAAVEVKEDETSGEAPTPAESELSIDKANANKMQTGNVQQDMQADMMEMAFGLWYVILIPFVYGLFFEGFMAATPGKLLMGMRVLDPAGNKCGFVKALIRNIIKYILTWISMIVALFNAERKAVHDMAAGTLVADKSCMKVGYSSRPANKLRTGRKSTAKDVDEDSASDDDEEDAGASASSVPAKPSSASGRVSKKIGKKMGKKVGKKIGKKIGKKVSKKIMRK